MSNEQYTRALRLLGRKHGATVDQIQERLGLPSEKPARGLIDRLRMKGHRIENIGPRRFRSPAAA